MNAAIILSGGIGSRMRRTDGCPKQYIEINGQPIIKYCLHTFVESKDVDGIVVVANQQWHSFLQGIFEQIGKAKFWGFAEPGTARQLSIYNGLLKVEETGYAVQKVIIHDAVRPLVSDRLIKECLSGLEKSAGVLPVLLVKDTCYQSTDGNYITNLLPREQLYAGQAPEAFLFESYLEAHRHLQESELAAVNGSSELAYKNGMDILLINGEEKNFKITTPEDLQLFKRYLESEIE